MSMNLSVNDQNSQKKMQLGIAELLQEAMRRLFAKELGEKKHQKISKEQIFCDFELSRSLVPEDLVPIDREMRAILKLKNLLAPAFKLMSVAGAYWNDDENEIMMQRISILAFESEEELAAHLAQIDEAERRDHRRIGKDMKLFFFHETAPGMPYWMPKGYALLNRLISWWREVHEREDYEEISSPIINSKKLWEISGHWDHYRDDMFIMQMDKDEVYGVKPMNCPNAMIMFNQGLHSYRNLPMRLSDCDVLHRHERSGSLHGLLRVQKFQQDDAHIFVEDQAAAIEKEFARILDLVDEFYSVFGLSYRFRIATRPKDSIGDDQLWERAEGALHSVLKARVGNDYEIAEGDGAFYGPKIDIVIKDAIGRDWQMGTLQLDYQLPRRFDCRYVDRNGQREFPVVIHRVIYGSMERFIGILIEHCAGAFPFWLAPEQVRVLPVSDKHLDKAEEIRAELKRAGFRASLDAEGNLGRKVKGFRLDKIPFAIVIGDQEIESGRIALRERGSNELRSMSIEELKEQFQKRNRDKK